ncbi:MAG: hypothetical protein EOO99_05500 [Pedobacter sp.]|nr:MAG: hypothetical protein EOO99_05500 [Pedobacter sp.]
MKKILLNLLFIASPILGFGQIAIDNGDVNFLRRTSNDEKARYEGITGNPFIIKDWTMGKTYTMDGESKEEYSLMYDLVENVLLTKKGNELLSFGNDVVAFTLKDLGTGSYRKFSRGYEPTKDTDKSTYYEELASGKLSLLKLVKKKIATSRNYDGTESKSIEEITRYYLATTKAAPLTQIKLDKNEFLNAMSDKKSEMEAYISKEKLNVKKAGDAAKLVNYYNTL